MTLSKAQQLLNDPAHVSEVKCDLKCNDLTATGNGTCAGNMSVTGTTSCSDDVTVNNAKKVSFKASDGVETMYVKGFGDSTTRYSYFYMPVAGGTTENRMEFHVGRKSAGGGGVVKTMWCREAEVKFFVNALISDGSAVTSDSRVKSNVQSLSDATCKEFFDKVNVKTYTRTDLSATTPRFGFLAQDLTSAFSTSTDTTLSSSSAACVKVSDYESPDGEVTYDDFQYVDYSRLVAILWGVVKQQEARIAALETQ